MLLRILVSDRTKELQRIYVEAIGADVLWDQFGCPPTRLIYPRLYYFFFYRLLNLFSYFGLQKRKVQLLQIQHISQTITLLQNMFVTF